MSSGKTGLLKVALNALHFTGADGLLSPLTRGVGVIFMLHRVRPDTPEGFGPNRILEVRPEGDPFNVLARLSGEASLEDAYLFGTTVRTVANQRDPARVRAILAAFGSPEAAEPSLEDVFVSLVKKRARAKELVTA